MIMPTYLQSALHTGFNQALLIAVISNVGFALTIIPAGIARKADVGDHRNQQRLVKAGMQRRLQVGRHNHQIGVPGGGPHHHPARYTGLGVAYSLSNALFSGCAGLIITGLIKQTGNLDIPAYYVMATAVVSIAALMTLNKDDHLRSLEE